MSRTVWLDFDGVVVQLAKDVEDYGNERIFSELPVVVGSRIFVARLRKLCKIKGVELKVISKTFFDESHKYTQQQKEDKIITAKSLGFKEKDTIVLSSEINKNEYCKPMDILIDDYGKNIEGWQDAFGIGIQAFEHKIKDSWITARSFSQILRCLDTLL